MFKKIESFRNNSVKQTMSIGHDPKQADRRSVGFVPTPHGIVGIETAGSVTSYWMVYRGKMHWWRHTPCTKRHTAVLAHNFAQAVKSRDDFWLPEARKNG